MCSIHCGEKKHLSEKTSMFNESSTGTGGGSAGLENLEPMLRRLIEEIDFSSLGPINADAAAPVLLQDLSANVAELGELCEVLSDRSLSATQLKALGELELLIGVLQEKSAHFVFLFQ
jgi:hypothetical protein